MQFVIRAQISLSTSVIPVYSLWYLPVPFVKSLPFVLSQTSEIIIPIIFWLENAPQLRSFLFERGAFLDFLIVCRMDSVPLGWSDDPVVNSPVSLLKERREIASFIFLIHDYAAIDAWYEGLHDRNSSCRILKQMLVHGLVCLVQFLILHLLILSLLQLSVERPFINVSIKSLFCSFQVTQVTILHRLSIKGIRTKPTRFMKAYSMPIGNYVSLSVVRLVHLWRRVATLQKTFLRHSFLI